MRTLRNLLAGPVRMLAFMWASGAMLLAVIAWALPATLGIALTLFTVAVSVLVAGLMVEARLERTLVGRDAFTLADRGQRRRLKQLSSDLKKHGDRLERSLHDGRSSRKGSQARAQAGRGDESGEGRLDRPTASPAGHDTQNGAAARQAGTQRPSPDFLHVIATRHGIGIFDEDWFDYRQHLLEYLTLASIDAQTVKDFRWLIVIDRDMPERARKRLESMVKGRPYLELLKVELKLDFKKAVAKWTRSEAAARGVDWVMTTRLDDDDAVNVDLVQRLHSEARDFLDLGKRTSAVFAPTSGCNWVPAERTGFRSFHPSPSMGLTLLEPVDEMSTVYRWNHMKIQEQTAPSMTYFKSIAGDTIWWLYAHTNISDQQSESSNRRSKAYTHSSAFRLDKPLLDRFGISLENAELLERLPEPVPFDTTHYLTKRGSDIEADIKMLRGRVWAKDFADETEAAAAREKIDELHSARKEMHRRIVRSPQSGT